RDIERHLNNEPVVASPPSRLYRFQKLVRRNRVVATAAGAVGLVMVLGVVASTWQAFRATRAERAQSRLRQEAQNAQGNESRARGVAQTEAAKSQQVAQILRNMLKVTIPAATGGRDTGVLKEILDKTAGLVGEDLANQPEVEMELRSALAEAYQD